MRKIYIIGSGAIGLALALCLKRSGKTVTLLRGREKSGVKSLKKIRLVAKDNSIIEDEVEFDAIDNYQQLDGMIVLTTKSYGNKAIAALLKNKINTSPIVLLQNGLGVEQPFLENNFPEIYRCVLFVTSQFVDEHTIRFQPVSDSRIGVIRGNSDSLREVVDHLMGPTFPFVVEPDIHSIIWMKAIINSAFNSICPLLEVDNGIFHRDKQVMQIAQRLIRECVLVANRSGISLSIEAVEEKLLQVSTSSDGQLISTLQDINNGRQTEIETLNLEIARIAKGMGLAEKITETRLLGEMILQKSRLTTTIA